MTRHLIVQCGVFIGSAFFCNTFYELYLSGILLLKMALQNLTPEQAIPKIKQYCAYQERCHAEVKDKLYSFGLHRKDVDEIIVLLIGENYLNEERFAIQYAGGKFRMKHWGR